MSEEKDKLKTLKDLSSVSVNHTSGNRKVIGVDLQEEAKKWIDELTQQHHQLNDGNETTLERNFEANRGCSVSDDGSVCDICHTLRWIKHFFDLGEEESKIKKV